jgi:hypothetical protein
VGYYLAFIANSSGMLTASLSETQLSQGKPVDGLGESREKILRMNLKDSLGLPL